MGFFCTDLHNQISFEGLKNNREILIEFANKNFILATLMFMGAYTLIVACSIPGATIFTLTAGILFGPIYGSIVVIISATLGAVVIFTAVRYALREFVASRTSKWMKIMEYEFRNNAFSYLLTLRLIPIFPFWLVNIVPGLLGVSYFNFITATFFGIIPGTVVYVLIGNNLSEIFARNEAPNFNIIFEPKLIIPLVALAILVLTPVIYKKIKGIK